MRAAIYLKSNVVMSLLASKVGLLHHAVKQQEMEMIKALLDAKCDVHAKLEVGGKEKTALELALEKDVENLTEAFNWREKKTFPAIQRCSAFFASWRNKSRHFAVAMALHPRLGQNSPLAALKPETIRAILSHISTEDSEFNRGPSRNTTLLKPSPDKPMEIALWYEECVLLLIEAGGSRGVQPSMFERPHKAAWKIVKSYLEKRSLESKPKIKEWELAVQEWESAVQRASITQIKLLLDQRVDINMTDENGDTALHHMVRANNYSVVAFLVENQASVDRRNGHGLRPIDLVESDRRQSNGIPELLTWRHHNPQQQARTKSVRSIAISQGMYLD
jgi:ankyrin repeat protein